MMDISRAVRGPIVCAGGVGGGRRLAENEAARSRGDGDPGEVAGDGAAAPKRKSADDDYVNAKKRRKQLKPIRIATNLDDMVKVPKQIIGLNNDLDDNVNDMSHAVPKESSSKTGGSPSCSLRDGVRARGDDDLCRGEGASTAGGGGEGPARDVDKPEIPDINVPNIDVGPNFIANPNYMYPFQAVKGPHFWSDANLKIFNQEAYCELCKKEFCNKYFLKTHKANKHGIYVDFPSGSSGGKARSGEGRSQPENGRGAAADADCERAFCELCNKRFCNKYFVRRHKTKSHGVPDEEGQHGLTCLGADSNPVQNAAINSTKRTVSIVTTCDTLALIAKENDFDNQGVGSDVQDSPLNLIVKEDASDGGEGEEEGERDGNDPAPGEEDKTNDGEDCSSENIEKLETMLMRLTPSEADGSGEHRCGTGAEKREYLSEANDSSNESTKNEFPGPAKNEAHDFLYLGRMEHMKQMKPTSSYCEICNKELCNKYFMRTHMQRMHGIEIEHGTQIGGVVCNICNKELCSKYFLRVHKQNTHGIVSPNSLVGASTSGGGGTATGQRGDSAKAPRSDQRYPATNFSQVCHICNKRFRSPKWLQAHFVSDHRDEASRPAPQDEAADDEDEREEDPVLKIPRKSAHAPEAGDPPEALDVISKLFWENNSSSKSYNCSQCPFTTSVLAFLFVHERSHFVLTQDPSSDPGKPAPSLQSLLHDQSFWQRKITQQISECLDLSSGKSKYLSFEQNGS